MDYLAFLSNFDRFTDIPMSAKKTGSYREYLNALKEYLIAFLARTRPLLSVDEEFEKADADFDKKWEEGMPILLALKFFVVKRVFNCFLKN